MAATTGSVEQSRSALALPGRKSAIFLSRDTGNALPNNIGSASHEAAWIAASRWHIECWLSLLIPTEEHSHKSSYGCLPRKTRITLLPTELPSVGSAQARSMLCARPNRAWGKLGSHVQFSCQIVKFSTLAKLTHARYGIISQPAVFWRLKNATDVATIAIQRTTISTKAQPG